MRVVWLLVLLIVAASCKTSSSAVDSASSYENYSEDLSSSLPSYPNFEERKEAQIAPEPATSPQAIDNQLEQIAKQQYDKNKSEPYFNGYKVLVYSGLDRDLAFKTQEKISMLFPDVKPAIQYEQPRYLVKVGKYAYKVEALKTYHLIKTEFPSARIIQDRILRKEFTVPSQSNDVEGQN